MSEFSPDESCALELDAADPLRQWRGQFCLPRDRDGAELIYFCGNSLGLQPRGVRELVAQELDDWAALGVDGHFHGRTPWYSYHQQFRGPAARLIGAEPDEVVLMNSLTVNLHLMLVSMYRPTADRNRILTDYPTFPSDLYAIKSHLHYHGIDPGDGLVLQRPRDGEHLVRMEDLEETIDRHGDRIAVILLGGVNFFTGQAFDLQRVTELARARGCVVGFDLAHAAGNVPLRLHDWDVDFAVWCSYKYLNSGPGAVAGCFVHQRHADRPDLPRFTGWWGNDPDQRFLMHLLPDFMPVHGAEGWQISNPPILAMTPLRASLQQFDHAGMPALREKSKLLTGYLHYLIDRCPSDRFEIITPRQAEHRGCQLSILVHDRPDDYHRALIAAGVVCDFRKPNVVRVAPAPLYNTFHEVWRFARVLAM